MLKKLDLVGIIIGVIIMVCAVFVFSFDAGINDPEMDGIRTANVSPPEYESDKSYGGDAYTGMQQASAQAANNLIPVFEAIEQNNNAIIKLNSNNIAAAEIEAENAEAIVSTIKHCAGFVLLAIGLTVISKSVELDISSRKKKEECPATEAAV